MSVETKDTLLYGQLQDGLQLELMQGRAVSGARNYQELCISAKNEEKRLADLKRRQEYAQVTKQSTAQQQAGTKQSSGDRNRTRGNSSSDSSAPQGRAPKSDNKCFYCKKPGHIMRDCRRRKKEVKESESRGPTHSASTKQVRVNTGDSDSSASGTAVPSNAASEVVAPPLDGPSLSNTTTRVPRETGESSPCPYDLLFSDSDDENGVKQVNVPDSGSRSQSARVDIQGVPADGIVDTAANITIIGGKLFALVASTARLRKKDFKKPDKVPRNYDRKVFHLDGCMDLDIAFESKTLRTTMYVKMDALDQLLLSEGVCRPLGIVQYHPSVSARKASKQTADEVPLVPSVRVSLVNSLWLPPGQSAVVPVRLDYSTQEAKETLIIEGHENMWRTGLVVENAVVTAPQDSFTCLVITNPSGFTQRITEGTVVGEAQIAEVLTSDAEPDSTVDESASVRTLSSSREEWRKKKLLEVLQLQDVPQPDAEQLRDFLTANHEVFSLEEGERGETALVTMDIDTGDAQPRKQAPRRMPIVVRQEVSKQLEKMQ